MAATAEDLIDRRRLRRKVTFWRVFALAVAALAIIGIAWALYDGGAAGKSVDHIAKVKIEGTILEDEDLLQLLEDLRKSPTAKGVIVSIDSPGGTTAGGEAIYEAVRAVAKEKPVVAQVGTLAASAGYMIASASDQIVARQSSIVGSIGVLAQIPNFSRLMDKIGISVDEVKSSPLKAEPSPFNPTTEEERAMLRSMIMDSYNWFIGLVEERRPLSRSEVLALADGSVFTGRQALSRKLVDRLGGEKEAIAWLGEKGVSADLKVIEWKPKKKGYSLLFGSDVGKAIGSLIGLPGAGSDLLRETGADRLFLDGLISLWHP
ncbi:signal peptide peptidase SppA [Pseudaminobacter sp. 19-2017]|uniref:Signal peptide peptidase SppA n=1 Tax=Pseudaminobacter soli (ex Zhang et al. 2022) TaxID=2831468 RepID=A0A942IA71_9HYPH|nr:signal peptide peptidase SppA [Pseudaminobacter soli]MBS3650151.1 signal peptide peptidase SppA [Pseudaminobacter soli]